MPFTLPTQVQFLELPDNPVSAESVVNSEYSHVWSTKKKKKGIGSHPLGIRKGLGGKTEFKASHVVGMYSNPWANSLALEIILPVHVPEK